MTDYLTFTVRVPRCDSDTADKFAFDLMGLAMQHFGEDCPVAGRPAGEKWWETGSPDAVQPEGDSIPSPRTRQARTSDEPVSFPFAPLWKF